MGKIAIVYPLHTCCFAVMICLIIASTVVMHVALVDVVPSIEDFPGNLEKGFFTVLRIGDMKTDSETVKTTSASALSTCGYSTPDTDCDPCCSGANSATPDLSSEIATIQLKMTNTLDTVKRFADDKYFGTTALQQSATDLQSMTTAVTTLQGGGLNCDGYRIQFCATYKAAKSAAADADNVVAEVNKIMNNEIIKKWKEYTENAKYFHAIPYVLVLSLICLIVFWLRGGICCCQEGGTMCAFFMIPCGILAVLFTIFNSVVLGAGIVILWFTDKYKVEQLNTNPTVEDALNHFQTAFPAFWNIVFANMEDGLYLWWVASIMFEIFLILFMCFACNMCCCKPYKDTDAGDTEFI